VGGAKGSLPLRIWTQVIEFLQVLSGKFTSLTICGDFNLNLDNVGSEKWFADHHWLKFRTSHTSASELSPSDYSYILVHNRELDKEVLLERCAVTRFSLVPLSMGMQGSEITYFRTENGHCIQITLDDIADLQMGGRGIHISLAANLKDHSKILLHYVTSPERDHRKMFFDHYFLHMSVTLSQVLSLRCPNAYDDRELVKIAQSRRALHRQDRCART
jgi:hypothetical protein